MERSRLIDIILSIFLIILLVLSSIVHMDLDGGLYFNESPIVSTCLFSELTGVKCPFCGISRSMVALMHGQFRVSMLYHPLGLLFVILIITYAISVFLTYYKQKDPVIEKNIFKQICLSIMILSTIIWIMQF